MKQREIIPQISGLIMAGICSTDLEVVTNADESQQRARARFAVNNAEQVAALLAERGFLDKSTPTPQSREAFLTAVEYGFLCGEKGWNLETTLTEANKLIK